MSSGYIPAQDEPGPDEVVSRSLVVRRGTEYYNTSSPFSYPLRSFRGFEKPLEMAAPFPRRLLLGCS